MADNMVDEDNDLKDSVQRLHRFIVDALRAKRDDPFGAPVTVSEIYQQLAPYRAVRTVLGFEMNADYEHALMRLLAGVDGLTQLDPPKAKERLAKELDSPNPDVGMYREFAACDVVLNPSTSGADWVREQLEEPDLPEPPRHSGSVPGTPAPDWTGLAQLDADTVDTHDQDLDEELDEELDERRAHATCISCDSSLPGSRTLRFCPFCGADQLMTPCPACGEAIEPGWVFCIACGTSVASQT